jgi:hypothetical protein
MPKAWTYLVFITPKLGIPSTYLVLLGALYRIAMLRLLDSGAHAIFGAPAA